MALERIVVNPVKGYLNTGDSRGGFARERKTKSVLPGQFARTARFSGFIFGTPGCPTS